MTSCAVCREPADRPPVLVRREPAGPDKTFGPGTEQWSIAALCKPCGSEVQAGTVVVRAGVIFYAGPAVERRP